MGANFYQAWWAWLTDFVVTIGVSLFTKKKDKSELTGLVYGLSPKGWAEIKFLRRPEVWGSVALVAALILNIIFW
jgi:SSS family solute:Na+ symporter